MIFPLKIPKKEAEKLIFEKMVNEIKNILKNLILVSENNQQK